MSKRIIMSVLFSVAISIGGFFVSCGTDSDGGTIPVIVQLPEGCFLISPKDALGSLTGGTPVVNVKPGKNRFVLSCGESNVEIETSISDGQRSVTFTDSDVR